MPSEAAASSQKKPVKRHRGVYEKVPGSGIWWVVYFAEGKRKREKVGRKSDAIALYQSRKSEVRAGVKMPANMRNKGESLATVIDRALLWYESHKPKSLYNVKIHLQMFKANLGKKVAAELTPDDIDQLLSKQAVKKSWSPATVNRYKTSLSRALQLALVSGHVKQNAARLVTSRAENNWRIRWVNEAEEKRLVEAIERNCPSQLPAFIVAIHTGMRKGEQFSLEWTEIDFERRKIFLVKTKNGSDREVSMSRTCHRVLSELKSAATNQWGVPEHTL